MNKENKSHRITITGSSGAGKTTLAIKIAKHFKIPIIHLDKYFWKPGWNTPDMNEWHDKVEQLVQEESWVMEGNYGSTFDVRFPRATEIIHMDFSRYLCLYRVLKRRIQSGKKLRPDLAPGCEERFELNFYKYIWDYPSVYGPRVYRDIDYLDAREKFTILKNSTDVSNYLKSLKS